jgi:hypothetical protein
MSSDDQALNDRSQLHFFDGMSKRLRHDYPATTVPKATLSPFKHLKKSNINQTIQKINQIILCLFKTKQKPDD